MNNLKLSELSVSDVNYLYDYPSLDSELKMLLEDELGENDLDLYYSLSYRQGDGLIATGVIPYETAQRLVATQLSDEVLEMYDNYIGGQPDFHLMSNDSHYYHVNTMYIEVESLDEADAEPSDLVNKADKQIAEFADTLLKEMKSICHSLEKAGYAHIEEEDGRDLANAIFNDFLEINSIESDKHIDDFQWNWLEHVTDEADEGWINIFTGSDSIYSGLQVKLPELTAHTRRVTTVEDGEKVGENNTVFYNFAN